MADAWDAFPDVAPAGVAAPPRRNPNVPYIEIAPRQGGTQPANARPASWDDFPDVEPSIADPSGFDAAFANTGQSQNPALGQGLEAEAARRQQPTGGFNNFTAGLNDAIYTTLGAPVDQARGAINLVPRAINAVAGTDIPTLPPGIGGSQSFARAGQALGVNDPGKVVASDAGDQIARAAGAGAGFMVAPEAVLGALGKAGLLSEGVMATLGPLFGRSSTAADAAGNAVVGAVGGVAGQVGGDLLPEQYRPLGELAGNLLGGGVAAGAMAVPGAVRAGGRAAADYTAPLTQGGRERAAGNTLRNAATDPQAVREMLETGQREIVPGSQPTTFQLTGDMGLGGLERAVATKDPTAFNLRRGEQNAARTGALEGIQPTGHPEAVVNTLRQTLADIDALTSGALDDATRAARDRTAALGGVGTPEGYGVELAGMAQPRVDQARAAARGAADGLGRPGTPAEFGATARQALVDQKAVAEAREARLWDAVDPTGTLNLHSTGVRKTAQEVMEALPSSAKPMGSEEAAIFATAARYPEVASFREMTALRSRVSDEMREELSRHGSTRVYARLSQLRGVIEADIEGAVAARAAQEADAVASGAMREEETMAARVSGWRDVWREEQSSRAGVGAGSGSNAAGGTRGVYDPREVLRALQEYRDQLSSPTSTKEPPTG